jgi:hypothetical protein
VFKSACSSPLRARPRSAARGNGYAIAILLALLLALGGAAGARARDGRTVSLDEYRAILERAAEGLASSTRTVEDVARELQGIAGVTLRSGETAAPWLLVEPDLNTAQALARLETVAAQLAASAADDSAARLALLDGIFARREFTQAESLIERLWRHFRQWLDSLFPEQSGAGSAAVDGALTALGWAVTAAALALIVFLLSYWLQGILRGFVDETSLGTAGAGDGEMPATAAEARRQASALAQQGSYRLAVRQLYLSALLALEERRLVALDRSLTNRELLAGAAGNAPLQEQLAPVVETFDDVWYGIHEPDAAAFAGYEQAIERLNETMERTADLPTGEAQ